MVILRTRNKITDFLMILAWASPFNLFHLGIIEMLYTLSEVGLYDQYLLWKIDQYVLRGHM